MKQSIVLILLLVFVSSCESTKHIKRFEAEKLVEALKAENGDLKKKIGALESQMNDTDQDGVPDYLDVENSSIAGFMVDTKGKMIDLNKNGLPDDAEKLMSMNYLDGSNRGNNTTPSKTVTFGKYQKAATKTIKIESEKLVLPENLMGNIAFNCPSEMREEQTYEVNAMLGALFSKDGIQKSLLKSINISRIENNEPPVKIEDVLTRQVNLGYYLNVVLEDSGNKFDIKRINELANPATQSILNETTGASLRNTYQWQWDVTPKPKSKGEGKLNLSITPLDRYKKPMTSKQKDYPITIHLKQNFLASIWEEMNRNIQWAVGSIIAPIITFFIGRYKRKEEKSNNAA